MTGQTIMRRCTKCKTEKPASLEHFGPVKQTKLGLAAACRDCCREDRRRRRAADPGADRRYYEANKHWLLPKMNERQRNWRAENLEEALAREQAYRDANREKQRAQRRARYPLKAEKERERLRNYYATNPERRAKRYAEIEAWRKANRETARTYLRNRRARIKSVGGVHTKEDVLRLIEGQKGHCWWCSKKIPKGKHHVDHRIPIARGGSNGPENLVITCAPCNLKKNMKMPWEMAVPRLF